MVGNLWKKIQTGAAGCAYGNVPDPIHAELAKMQMDSLVARFAFFGSLAAREEEEPGSNWMFVRFVCGFSNREKSRNKRDCLNYTIEGAWKRKKKNARYLLVAYAFLDVL